MSDTEGFFIYLTHDQIKMCIEGLDQLYGDEATTELLALLIAALA